MTPRRISSGGPWENAVREAGLDVTDVVRTRLFVRDIHRQDEVGRAHRELIGDVMPACTLVEVSGLIHPDHLVEVDAYRSPEGTTAESES